MWDSGNVGKGAGSADVEGVPKGAIFGGRKMSVSKQGILAHRMPKAVYWACLLLLGLLVIAVPRAAQAQEMQIIAGYVPTPANYPPLCIPLPLGPIYICNSGDTAATNGSGASLGDYSATYPDGLWIPAPAPAISDEMHWPVDVAAAPNGDVYIVDQNGISPGPPQIRVIDSSGNMATYALEPFVNGQFVGIFFDGVAVDSLGNVYFGDSSGKVYKNVQCSQVGGTIVPGSGGAGNPVSISGGPLWTCQNNTTSPPSSSPQPFTGNQFATVAGEVDAIATDSSNNVYVLSNTLSGFWTISEWNGSSTLLASVSSSSVPFLNGIPIYGLVADSKGDIYTVDPLNGRIVKITMSTGAASYLTAAGQIPNLAGTQATDGLAIDAAGNVYAVVGGGLVDKLNIGTGAVTQFAGTGTNGFNAPNAKSMSEDFSPAVDAPSLATATDINNVNGISIGVGGPLSINNANGGLYIADTYNNLVREVPMGPPVVRVIPASSNPFALSAGPTYTVTVTVTNAGNVTISPLTLQTMTLGGLSSLSFAGPTSFAAVPPGSNASFTATFSLGAGTAGTSVPLSVSGTYAAGSLSGHWSVTVRAVTLP